jgi:hypothetical protein
MHDEVTDMIAKGPDRETVAEARQLHADRVLTYAALLYLVGFVLHTGDHLRRGVDVLTPEVFWAGIASSVIAVAAIALALVGHRMAPLVAVAVGFPAALGVAAVHLAPDWGVFSDSLPDGNVDALTWVAVLVEIGGALALGAAGAYLVRSRSHAALLGR